MNPDRDTSEAVTDGIRAYLAADSAPYAIAISGEWGVGKTHLVQSAVGDVFDPSSFLYLSLYGLSTVAEIEAAILAAGYAPAVGFIHSGKPLSFVYDVADIFKFETVVPLAFKIAAKNPSQPDRQVRIACREIFRQTRLLNKIIPSIEEMLADGGIDPPPPPKDAQPPAIPEPEAIGDEGHRSK